MVQLGDVDREKGGLSFVVEVGERVAGEVSEKIQVKADLIRQAQKNP